MLKDVVEITQQVFNKFALSNEELNFPKNVYAVYSKLAKVLDTLQLVSEHYLALSFDEEYLQNSSFGEPSDKWRYFFNKDLNSLNGAVKEYLLILSSLAAKDDDSFTCSGYISKIYESKSYYGFVRDEYSVGFIEPCSFMLITKKLSTKVDAQTYHLEEFQKTELATYKQRVSLQQELQERHKKLLKLHGDLKAYMLHNYTLKDLL